MRERVLGARYTKLVVEAFDPRDCDYRGVARVQGFGWTPIRLVPLLVTICGISPVWRDHPRPMVVDISVGDDSSHSVSN